ncbi:MAG TPA: hypothetical protein PK954_16205, partial [Anaerolineales bacterium]|nr:hypothetical protein [Anaerolineales bacterium]
PNSPVLRTSFSSAAAPTNRDDNFGGRLRAILCVPMPGQHTFWIASDDSSSFRMSSYLGTDLASIRSNAYVSALSLSEYASVSGYTNVNEWNKYGSQQSSALTLQAGYYYIEALYKEGTGGDNLSLGWRMPSESFSYPSAVIPQTYLYLINGFPTATPTATATPTRTPTWTRTP